MIFLLIALYYISILHSIVLAVNQLSPGDGYWGEWTDWSHCPNYSYAKAFKLRIPPHKGIFRDDSGLNSIELKCADINGHVTR